MDVQGTATVTAPPGERDPGTGCLEDSLDGRVGVAHPRVHHASREEPHVGPGRDKCRLAQRHARQPESLGNHAQSLGDGAGS